MVSAKSEYDTSDDVKAVPKAGFPPNFGQPVVDHIMTFSGMSSALGQVYRVSDESILHDPANARFMLNDLVITECIEARRRAVALLNWHIEPEDKKNNTQKGVCDQIKLLCENIPRFTQYREQLSYATWYGKAGVSQTWGKKRVRRKMATIPVQTEPINGDKIVFRWNKNTHRYDETNIGIRVGTGSGYHVGSTIGGRFRVEAVDGPSRVYPTDYGNAYFIPKNQRALLALHRHYIEDGEFEDPQSAGRINGVGIRSKIYTTWYQKQETLAWLMEYLERSASGFEVWYYQWGNPESETAVRHAAQERIGSRNIIVCPYIPDETGRPPYERIEPSMAGADAMKSIVIEYFGHLIKRYILGQTLTSEQGSGSGMNSNLADVHLATFLQIVKYDSTLLEETITEELIRPLVLYNFPEWADYDFKFRIDTESEDMEGKLSAYKSAWEMGLALKSQDVYDAIGAAKPGPSDEILKKQDQPPGGGGPGQPGGDGASAGAGGLAAGMTQQLLQTLSQKGMIEQAPQPAAAAAAPKPGKPAADEPDEPKQYSAIPPQRPEDSERIKLRDYAAGKKWDETNVRRDKNGRFSKKLDPDKPVPEKIVKSVKSHAGNAMALAHKLMRSKHTDYTEFRSALADAWLEVKGKINNLYLDEHFKESDEPKDKPTPKSQLPDDFDLPAFIKEVQGENSFFRNRIKKYAGDDDEDGFTDTEKELLKLAAKLKQGDGDEDELSRDFVEGLQQWAEEKESSESAVEHYDRASGERWITIGGHDDGEAKHRDGTPVKIDGSGRITGGPAALAGKQLGQLDQEKKKDGGLGAPLAPPPQAPPGVPNPAANPMAPYTPPQTAGKPSGKTPPQGMKINGPMLRKAFSDQRGAMDLNHVSKQITGTVQNAIQDGFDVTLHVDGRPVRIVGIKDGMMQDGQGQRWGIATLASGNDDKNQIRVTPKPQQPAAPAADPRAAKITQLRGKLSAAIQQRPPHEQEKWRGVINGAMNAIPSHLHERVADAVQHAQLFERKELGDFLRSKGVNCRGDGPHGAADVSTGHLMLDGMDSEANLHPVQTACHEIAHLLDKEGDTKWAHSNSPEWQDAFTSEINQNNKDGFGRLSEYAKSSAREGWAEFGRLAWMRPDIAARDFPKAWSVFSSKGMV